MIWRTTGEDVAEQAVTGGYVGIPYSKLDCQAFVEQVLKDLGVRKENGKPYNWTGSNSMWRNHVTWKGTIEECKKKFGGIPLGAFLFLLKWDGGETEQVPEAGVPLTLLRKGRKAWVPRVQGASEAVQEKV